MEQKLLPPEYEEYNDIIRIGSMPIKPIERLKSVYYQFDVLEARQLIKTIKEADARKGFLLQSEQRFLQKFTSVIAKIREPQSRIHFIRIKDCVELIELSIEATFDRIRHILDKIIAGAIGQRSDILEDKIIFAIRSNLRLIDILQENEIDVSDKNDFQRIISNYGIILRNIISINESTCLKKEEAQALLDDVISETSQVWSTYRRLKDLEVPKCLPQSA